MNNRQQTLWDQDIWVFNPQDEEMARAVTEEAIARSESNSDEEWVAAAREAGIRAARTYATLTSDQVWANLTDVNGFEWQPREPSVMGPSVMRWLASKGYIRRIPDVSRQSLRPSAHMKPLPLYQSLVFGGAA
jgi:hypothetical protein